MPAGQILASERRAFTQPETGVTGAQLTVANCRNTNLYYNHEQFLSDPDRLVFHSDRSGARQAYSVQLDSGQIVQLTDVPGGIGGLAAAPARNAVYYSCGDEIYALDTDSLQAEPVAHKPDGCASLALQDVSSCGRYLVLSARTELMNAGRVPGSGFRHGSPNLVLLCDAQERRQTIVYEGPTAEVPVAADSHLFISRDDPSFVFWGSYTRKPPTGYKTAWVLDCDITALAPRRDPRPLFAQQPYEFINHYYPAPNARAQMPLYEYTEWDRDGVPDAAVRAGAVSRAGNYLPKLLDVDLATGATRRWLFPGQPPLHFKGNPADDMWTGDCADPGFLWFSGRDAEKVREEEADPALCPDIPENHAFHWRGSGAWIGVFQKRGAYLEARPLVRHNTHWKAVHPHPTFSPDGRWIAYAAGDAHQSQIYIAEAVWPRWFM